MEPIPAVEEEMMWTTKPILEDEKKMLETMKMDELPEDKMFKLVHHGKWKEVVSLYEKYPDLRDKPLTGTNETTLHMAIMTKNEDVVAMLLNVLKRIMEATPWGDCNNDDVKRILTTKNDDGATPIHLAAERDMDTACSEMASLYPDLVKNARNKKGETPLFTAVRHGKKKAFFALELSVQNAWPNPPPEKMKRDVTHCRRGKDGNNILHIAIYGEYFDLAYEIVHLYPIFVNYVNERGESPLHYLANKPSSFKSGTSFNLFDQAIYSCIFIELAEKTKREFDKYKSEHESDKSIERPSDDHEASIISKWSETEQAKNDEENPGGVQQESSKEEKKRLPFSKIYKVGVFYFQIVMTLLLIILGIVLRRIGTLKKMKQKHNHAYQLMNELVGHNQSWEYEKKDGMKLHIPSFDLSFDQIPSYDLPSELSTLQDHLDLVSKNLKPERSEIVTSGGRILSAKIIASEYPRSKHARVKWNLPILDKQKAIDEDIYVLEEEASNEPDNATTVLVAAKNGITEMVKKILDTFPVALLDLDKDEKNIVLLAAEYRQMHIYDFIYKREIMNDSAFRKVDKNGNSALHLVAKLSHGNHMPAAISHLQWEIQSFNHVLNSMDRDFFAAYNNEGKTAQHVFTEEHTKLVKEAGKWMSSTSNSCSVIAALIAGVSFNSVATVPGGPNQISGVPILFDKFPFQVFAFSSLVSFCCSVSSLIIFLTIISSRYREQDFERTLPAKLIMGLSSLFTAIVALLVSFGAGNFFVVNKELNYVAFAIYALTFFPVIFYAIQHFPFYVDFVWATVIQRSRPFGKIN